MASRDRPRACERPCRPSRTARMSRVGIGRLRAKRQQRLTRAVRDPNCQITPSLVAQNVDARCATDAAREMSTRLSGLSEHQVHTRVARIVRCAEEWVVELLGLRADLGIVDLEDAPSPGVASRKLIQ